MRVSVVATGIDAVGVQTDIPVPRRKMADTVADPVVETSEEETISEDIAARVETAEPSLFPETEVAMDESTAEDIAASDAGDASAPQVGASDDELPPPAYTPQVEDVAVVSAEEEMEDYVAPQAHPLGTPSPEAMARLQAAASKVPDRPADEARESAPAERPRFGINSLINRMTGHGSTEAQAEPRPARQQPPVEAPIARQEPEAAFEEEEDQIEIPAFLRRQAN